MKHSLSPTQADRPGDAGLPRYSGELLPGPPRRRTRRHRGLLVMLAVLVLVLGATAGSVVPALTAPGTQSNTARLAEWARNHGLGAVVTWLEQLTYQQPKVGGTPKGNSPLHHAQASSPPSSRAAEKLPAAIPPPATPALPGEGSWRVVARVHGRPAMAEAFLRPDAVHTSYTVGAVWFNPHLVAARLHPGAAQPGGSGWTTPPSIAHPSGLLAAFNSGFKLTDAHGGFYADGRYAKSLVPGAASMVFRRDGSMTVGRWGRDVRMGPSVAAVRQNLVLLVDHGRVVPGIDTNTTRSWGATIGNKKYVWRSGIGVTAQGNLIDVIGPRLSAHSLADLLHRAGCVRAMELDINPEWTSFVRYPASATSPTRKPVNLLSTMHRSPRRYNTTSARDFVTLHAR
ncbi:MAG: phosphodiester glycosidase family protein [Sciscionella sp.]